MLKSITVVFITKSVNRLAPIIREAGFGPMISFNGACGTKYDLTWNPGLRKKRMLVVTDQVHNQQLVDLEVFSDSMPHVVFGDKNGKEGAKLFVSSDLDKDKLVEFIRKHAIESFNLPIH